MAGGVKVLAALALSALVLAGPAARADEALPRVASNNLCTDQILLALAEPSPAMPRTFLR